MSVRKAAAAKTTPKPPSSRPAGKTTTKETTEKPAAQPPEKDLLRKRELVERVVKRSGIKKRDAKPVIEVMLAELGEALASGRELSLPPLGRVVINREKELPDGRVIVVKVRQKSIKDVAGDQPETPESAT